MSQNCIYSENVVNYIAGFVQRKLEKSLDCTLCRKFLQNGEKLMLPLTSVKNRGGLFSPEKNLNYIIKASKGVLDTFIANGDVFSMKNVVKKVTRKVIVYLNVKKPMLLNFLNLHQTEFPKSLEHRLLFIENAVSVYCSIRLHHLAKEKNSNIVKNRVRHKYNKLIIFSNQ